MVVQTLLESLELGGELCVYRCNTVSVARKVAQINESMTMNETARMNSVAADDTMN